MNACKKQHSHSIIYYMNKLMVLMGFSLDLELVNITTDLIGKSQ